VCTLNNAAAVAECIYLHSHPVHTRRVGTGEGEDLVVSCGAQLVPSPAIFPLLVLFDQFSLLQLSGALIQWGSNTLAFNLY